MPGVSRHSPPLMQLCARCSRSSCSHLVEISVAFHKSKTPKSAAAGCGNTRPPLRADRLRAICWISTNERKHLRASVHTGGRRRNSLRLPLRRHSMHAYALDD